MSELARAAGFVLAGGRSIRMGRDKALLDFKNGITLVEAVAAQVLKACGSVTLLGDPERYGHLGIRVVPDLIPGRGPLSGLHAALALESAGWILLVPCDMPNIEARFLLELIDTAARSNAKCVAAKGPRGLEPLCAVYHRSTRVEVEEALAAGRLRMRDLLAQWGAIGVEADPRWLRNVNTEDDWHLYLTEKERSS